MINNNQTTPLVDPPDFRSAVSLSMGIIGLLSSTLSGCIICLIIGHNLYQKLHVRLLLQLCISDFIQGLAGASSLGWVKNEPSAINPSELCLFQSMMFQLGDLGSAISSLFIVFYVWATIHRVQYTCVAAPGKRFGYIALFCGCFFPILFSVIGWIRYRAIPDQPLYTAVGFRSWCWISESYPTERMMIHHTWIFLICFTLFILYIHVIITIKKIVAESDQANTIFLRRANFAKKMIGFPLVYFCAFVPLALERLVSAVVSGYMSDPFPHGYLAFAICMVVANGTMNSILYGYERKIFHRFRESTIQEKEITNLLQ